MSQQTSPSVSFQDSMNSTSNEGSSPSLSSSSLPPAHPRPTLSTIFDASSASQPSSGTTSLISSLTSSPTSANRKIESITNNNNGTQPTTQQQQQQQQQQQPIYSLTNSSNSNANSNQTSIASSTTPGIISSTFIANKSALTASMSDAARIDPKPFPYQPSKDAALHDNPDEFVIIEATPADKRFEQEVVHVQVSKADAAYQLQPIHCGRQVVFLNAQDPNFYTRELRNPSLYVWILAHLSIKESHALKRLFESGWRQNIQVKIMEINKFELVASKEGLENILYEGLAVELPDCIFNRVGAAVSYFGLAVIRQLENMGCLILNTLKSIEISRDKMLTVQTLAAHGLPIPKTILAKFPMNLNTIKREFEYPIIIKKVSGSQGKGIIKVDSHAQLEDLVDMLDTGKPLIFQEFISASAGKDLRVFVIGGRVVGAMMRVAAKGNFKANVHQGGSVKPVKISPQVEWLVLETVKIIGLDIAGVDLLIDKNTYKICEVNSSPGFEGLEKALGENIAVKCFQYMKFRLGVWRRGGKTTGKTVSVTVPIAEEDLTEGSTINNSNTNQQQQQQAAENYQIYGNNSNSNGNHETATINPSNIPSISPNTGNVSNATNANKEEKDKYRTLPRNRSMKRTSGQGAS